MALPESPSAGPALAAEARSLAALAKFAERLDVTIALENLAPLYPGPETLSANPLTLRGSCRASAPSAWRSVWTWVTRT